MNVLAVSLFLFICLITLIASVQVLGAKAREDCPAVHGEVIRAGVPGLRWLAMACRPDATRRTDGRLNGIIWTVRIMVFVVLFVVVRLMVG